MYDQKLTKGDIDMFINWLLGHSNDDKIEDELKDLFERDVPDSAKKLGK